MILENYGFCKNCTKVFENLLNWNEFEFKMWSKSATDSFIALFPLLLSLRFVWIYFLCWKFILIKNHHSPNCFSQKNRIISRIVRCLLNQGKSKFWAIYRIAVFVLFLNFKINSGESKAMKNCRILSRIGSESWSFISNSMKHR